MGFSSQPTFPAYSKAIENVVVLGNQVIQSLSDDQNARDYAYRQLVQAVEDLGVQTARLNPEASVSGTLFAAAMEMQTGDLLAEARKGINDGSVIGIQRALNNLVAEQRASDGAPIADLKFEDDLLRPPRKSLTDATALAEFKKRAGRTLDNMVKEAEAVLTIAIREFKEKFHKFFEALDQLITSFSSNGGLMEGIKKIVGSLKKIAELLKNDGLKRIIASLKEMVDGLDLAAMIAKAFGCANTKSAIAKLKVSSTINRKKLHGAGIQMAKLSREYILLLKQMKRLLGVIGIVGGLF